MTSTKTPTQAQTDCIQQTFNFQDLGRRKVVADFTGGYLSSDGGSLLLSETDQITGLSKRLAACFIDHRDQRFVDHRLDVLLRQRIIGIALGYEDLNDHDELRYDPLLAAACGREDVLGKERRFEDDKGKALAGKSTLNRLELGAEKLDSKTKKIASDPKKLEALLMREGVKAIPRKSEVIILDFDATDDPLHGGQEDRFFNSHYGNYCYMPLYCFCGDIPLLAQLRSSDCDGSKGTLEALKKLIPIIRKRFGKKVKIILRGDSGFCRDAILSWIEKQQNVHYVVGLARNKRLQRLLAPTFWDTAALLDEKAVSHARSVGAEKAPEVEGTARCFHEFYYSTLKSWSRQRRVIGKAEITNGKKNPRFIVTDLTGKEDWSVGLEEFKDGQHLYEKFYCARGNMENRIKEQQLDLFADRTSTAYLKSNQLRLWFSTFAYLLLRNFRAKSLVGTELANATVGTIRLKLLKIAAQVTVSVRRIYVQLSSAYPYQKLFAHAHANLHCEDG